MAARSAHLSRTLSHIRPSTSSLSARCFSTTLPSTPTTRTSTRPPPRTSTTQQARHASNFESSPSPFRLPPDQQAEFERLQRTANTQEGFNPTSTPDFSSSITSTQDLSSSPLAAEAEAAAASPDPDAPNTPLRKGAPPEFEGDVNPRTGEVGGPKNEPLRWGAGGDYSFNGRVTDF